MENLYHFTECGIDNVWLSSNNFVFLENENIRIPNINGLYDKLVISILGNENGHVSKMEHDFLYSLEIYAHIVEFVIMVEDKIHPSRVFAYDHVTKIWSLKA